MGPTTLKEMADLMRRDRVPFGGVDWEFHLRRFLDSFYAADLDTGRQTDLLADDPGPLGDRSLDVFVAAVGEHLARRWGLHIPSWVFADGRTWSDIPLFSPDEPVLRERLRHASPAAFRSRNVFVGAEPLQRARFPYARLGIDPTPKPRTLSS